MPVLRSPISAIPCLQRVGPEVLAAGGGLQARVVLLGSLEGLHEGHGVLAQHEGVLRSGLHIAAPAGLALPASEGCVSVSEGEKMNSSCRNTK